MTEIKMKPRPNMKKDHGNVVLWEQKRILRRTCLI